MKQEDEKPVLNPATKAKVINDAGGCAVIKQEGEEPI
jgi:hypothetical protein